MVEVLEWRPLGGRSGLDVGRVKGGTTGSSSADMAAMVDVAVVQQPPVFVFQPLDLVSLEADLLFQPLDGLAETLLRPDLKEKKMWMVMIRLSYNVCTSSRQK